MGKTMCRFNQHLIFLNPFACREEQLVVGNLALGNYQVKKETSSDFYKGSSYEAELKHHQGSSWVHHFHPSNYWKR